LGETDLIINQLPAGLYGFDLAEKYGVPMAISADGNGDSSRKRDQERIASRRAMAVSPSFSKNGQFCPLSPLY
jgi:hypothetical protein